MCTLLVWKNRHPRYPVVVAANRDEFEGRPSTDPLRLSEQPLVAGGRDEVAGGTWLAVSEHGIILALTNRRGAGRHDPAKRSRGTLVVEMARHRALDEIDAALRAIDVAAYNPFVLVALDSNAGVAARAGDDGLQLTAIADGVHAVTNWEMDDQRHPKSRRALQLAAAVDIYAGDDLALVERLHRLLADHAPGASGNDGGLCVHRLQERYGTRSSAIVLLDATGNARLYYGRGHACENRMLDVSALLRREDSASAAVER